MTKCDTEMQNEQMLLEKWHLQTGMKQGYHTPSIYEKKKNCALSTTEQGLLVYLLHTHTVEIVNL